MDVGRVNLDIPDSRNDLFASDRARLTIMKLHQRFEHITYDSNVPNVISTQDSGCEQICTVNYKLNCRWFCYPLLHMIGLYFYHVQQTDLPLVSLLR
ncbi:hypothetical protein Aduo_011768 [Ancylostoma duodenale]